MAMESVVTACRRGKVPGLFLWRRLCGLQEDYLGWHTRYSVIDLHGVLGGQVDIDLY